MPRQETNYSILNGNSRLIASDLGVLGIVHQVAVEGLAEVYAVCNVPVEDAKKTVKQAAAKIAPPSIATIIDAARDSVPAVDEIRENVSVARKWDQGDELIFEGCVDEERRFRQTVHPRILRRYRQTNS